MKKLIFSRQSVFAVIIAAAPNFAAADPEIATQKGKSIIEELLGDRNREVTGDLSRAKELYGALAVQWIANDLQDGKYTTAYLKAFLAGFVLNVAPSSGGDMVLAAIPLGKTGADVGQAVTAAQAYITILRK